MSFRIIGSGKKTRYLIDNVEVTKAEFERACPDKPLDFSHGSGITAWLKPVVSNALGCHPSQIKEVMERNAKAGIHTEYLPDGRPVLRSQGEKEALCRLENCHDREGGYRAAGPRN